MGAPVAGEGLVNVDMSEMAPGPNQTELNQLGEDEQQPLCKQPGCDQPALTTFGPYGRLCAEHKAAVQRARKTAKPTQAVKPVRRPAGGSDIVEAVLAELRAELASSQQRTDRLTKAIAALEQLGGQA